MAGLLRRLRRWGSRSELVQQAELGSSGESCCGDPDQELTWCASCCDREVLLCAGETLQETLTTYCLIPPAILRET